MALAIRLDNLLRAGEVGDYAELRGLARSRARVTQIMNLFSSRRTFRSDSVSAAGGAGT